MMESHMNNGMCRCCSSEGTFKDVKSKYNWMGEEEVYSEMLRECFDIVLSSNEGDDGGICEVCITQLRNAANFKKQVLYTEDQFKKRLNDKMLKSDIKIEFGKFDSDNESDNDNDNNMSEDFSAPEFDVPIKKEEDEPKPKKRAAAKATTSKAKKAKTNDGETSTKRIQRHFVIVKSEDFEENVKKEDDESEVKSESKRAKSANLKTRKTKNKKGKMSKEKKMKEDGDAKLSYLKIKEELAKHHTNIKEIMKYSNATPIKSYGGIGFMCCYCDDKYAKAADLKLHTIEKHNDISKASFMQKKMNLYGYCVKLDITELKCKICEENINTLEKLINHLKEAHNSKVHTDLRNNIMCFKFDNGDTLRCFLCSNVFYNFKSLQEHAHVHYRHDICHICDAGFINRRYLVTHIRRHRNGVFKCSHCPKEFNTNVNKLLHEKTIHKQQPLNRCGYCNELFIDYNKKLRHITEVHGVQTEAKCTVCNKTFLNSKTLREHVRRLHLMEKRYACELCGMAFFGSNEFDTHMIKHTGVGKFKCEVCQKAYVKKTYLKDHMKIHENDRQHKCEVCGREFVQKSNYTTHMRNQHGQV